MEYIVPDVLKRKYGPEVDIWSIGVMLYILLYGVPLFWAESETGIFKAILEGPIDLSNDPWPNISDGTKDLVKKMLAKDPTKRLTAFQVLNHLWIKEDDEAPDVFKPPSPLPLPQLLLLQLPHPCPLPRPSLRHHQALLLSDIDPDKHTFPFVLCACAFLFASSEGAQIRAHVSALGLSPDTYVANSLVHFYPSCGSPAIARKVFDQIPQ